jgi:hypothetical protein
MDLYQKEQRAADRRKIIARKRGRGNKTTCPHWVRRMF